MPQISKPQLKFILELLLLIRCLRGRAKFRNFSRYRDYHEQTVSRWYRQSFNFDLSQTLINLPSSQTIPFPPAECILSCGLTINTGSGSINSFSITIRNSTIPRGGINFKCTELKICPLPAP